MRGWAERLGWVCWPSLRLAGVPATPFCSSGARRRLISAAGCGKTTLLGSIAGSAMDLGSSSSLTGTVEVDGHRWADGCWRFGKRRV